VKWEFGDARWKLGEVEWKFSDAGWEFGDVRSKFRDIGPVRNFVCEAILDPREGLRPSHDWDREWTQSRVLPYPAGSVGPDVEDDVLLVSASAARVRRGGGFPCEAAMMRSAGRGTVTAFPFLRRDNVGFRVARTIRRATAAPRRRLAVHRPERSARHQGRGLAAHGSGAVRFRAHVPEELRVRRLGPHVALCAVRTRLEVAVGGAPVAGTYRYSRVWAREPDGAWRVVGGHVIPRALGHFSRL
jgi:hypothetical protein